MRKDRRQRGFTLLELAITLSIAAVVITVALIGAGRFFVENNDALRAASARGLTEARVTERHNFFAGRRGCTSDDAVAFTVAGQDAHGQPAEMTVCCGTWFKGCTVR
ncbi:MAG TPA: type II secretion system protein [Candidatus Binatia bacterium]|jgi:prepilin-type N-terminal cleavage/methylation domain-containing protein|nr:type II secretion system protein [Candidatus Binatia bacterium]